MRRSLAAVVLALWLAAPVGVALADGEAAGAGEAPTHVEGAPIASELDTAPAVAKRLFRDIVCLCGGCQRLPLSKCTCGYAKEERQKILAALAGRDLSTAEGEEAAYIAVRDLFIKEYGGQHVLTVPIDAGFNRLGVIVPAAVVILALTLVVIVGRRWVRRGRAATAAVAVASAAAVVPAKTAAEEDLEDRLDDELRDID